MAEPHLIGALRKKRAEIFGRIIGLEKELRQRRVDLKHVDATLRLFAPGLMKHSGRLPWLRRGECSRLVLDILRNADKPLTTQEIWEQLLKIKRAGDASASPVLGKKEAPFGAGAVDAEARDALHKTVLAALTRGKTKGLIERIDSSQGVAASWRIVR